MQKLTLLLPLLLVMLLFGCAKDEAHQLEEEKTVIQGISIEEFQQNGMLLTSVSELEEEISNGFGSTPENPVVMLAVDKSQQLIVLRDEYQEIFEEVMEEDQNLMHDEFYFTDFQTYNAVVQDSFAHSDYSFPVDSSLFMFDAYKNHSRTREETERLMGTIIELPQTDSLTNSAETRGYIEFEKEDILIGQWHPSASCNWFGHAAIISNAPSYGGEGDLVLSNTTTFDAWAKHVNYPSKDIGYQNGNRYWNTQETAIWWRARLRHKWANSSQLNSAVSYAVAQDPDTYSLWTPLWNNNRWYCSKLVWRSYYHYIGDISGEEWYRGYVLPSDFFFDFVDIQATFY